MTAGRITQLAAVTLFLAAGLGCQGSLALVDGEHPAGSVVIQAQLADLEISVPAKGYLEALEASPIAVPRVPTGALKVKELVPEGSLVEPGEVVIVFDDSQLNIELSNHKASFRSADRRIDGTQYQSEIESGSIRVMRQIAELERDNAEAFQLVDETIYSRLEILETEVKKDDAVETIVFAEAALLLRGEYYDIEERILNVEKGQVAGKIDRVETSLGNLVLKTPIGGLVVYKKNWRGASVGIGDTIWPGNVIMSIVNPESTALTAHLLEKDSAGIEVGARAEIRVDARPDRVFVGRVTTIAELSRPIERGSPVKYSEIRVELDDGDPTLLKPGMKGEARIVAGRVDDAVIVPRSALRGNAETPYVLIAGLAGTERRAVTLGAGDGVRVTIATGLEGGERILLGGAPDEQGPTDRSETSATRASGG